MASSLVKMGAADGEVNVDAFAFDIERVMEKLGSMDAELDTSAVIDEDTGRVSYGTSVNVDQEVCVCVCAFVRVLSVYGRSSRLCLPRALLMNLFTHGR